MEYSFAFNRTQNAPDSPINGQNPRHALNTAQPTASSFESQHGSRMPMATSNTLLSRSSADSQENPSASVRRSPQTRDQRPHDRISRHVPRRNVVVGSTSPSPGPRLRQDAARSPAIAQPALPGRARKAGQKRRRRQQQRENVLGTFLDT